jgi:hypothetical protein
MADGHLMQLALMFLSVGSTPPMEKADGKGVV